MIDVATIQSLIVSHIWQSVLLAALLAGALILGRRMPGRTRYGLALAALAGSVLLPMSAFLPRETLVSGLMDAVGAPVASGQPVEAASPAAAAPASDAAAVQGLVVRAVRTAMAATSDGGAIPSVTPAEASVFAAASGPETSGPASSGFAWRLPDLGIPDFTLPFLAIWAIVAIVLLARIGRDLIAVERMVAQARPVVLPGALAHRLRRVRVAISPEAPGPMAAGLLRPCIILPESMAGDLSAPGLAALLEHERAHIERRDMLAALAQRLLVALLWWSPALHWISRRMDEEREVACDETAVERTGDARAFARSLTSQAENQLWVRAPRLAVGAIGPRSHFSRRVRRLIEIAKSGVTSSRYSGRVAFSALVLCAGLAVVATPRIGADTPDAPPEETFHANDMFGERFVRLAQFAQQPAPPSPAPAPLATPRSSGSFDGRDGELSTIVADILREVQIALDGIGPELEAELAGLDAEFAGLDAELAGLGIEIAQLASQGVLAELPGIMQEVRLALQDADLEGHFDSEEFRQEMEDMRQELRESLGPEFRQEMREAMREAREELNAHREEIRAAMNGRHFDMEHVRHALEQAREEIKAARERGDFHGDFDFDFDADFDVDALLEDLRSQGVLDGGVRFIRTSADGAEGSPLYTAARRGDAKRVRELLAGGADANQVIRGDGTPLIAAVRSGRLDVVRTLLDGGADVNKASPGDGNPLIVAAMRGGKDAARLLLERGADANAYVKGDETPLINAASKGDLEMVRMLVNAGANVNLAYNVDAWGPNGVRKELRSPLGMAEKHQHKAVADFLRSKGAIRKPQQAN